MQEKYYQLDTPVRYFKGVGPKKAELLSGLGLNTAEDMLYHLPAKYEDRSNVIKVKDLKIGLPQTVQGEVVSSSSRISMAGLPIFQAAIKDETGIIHAVWFNQPYLKDYFKKGIKAVLYGKVELHERLQMMQPEYELLKGDDTDSIHIGRIVPVYPLTEGISQRYIRALGHEAVSRCAKLLPEKLPTYIRARTKLVDIKFAVNNIHFPLSFDNLERAYRRIVFEEFFMLQLALALKKKDLKARADAPGHKTAGAMTELFMKSLSFELTAGQKSAISDIESDMSGTRPMSRLLEGDVGSGKTVVASYALTLTAQNGFQGVMMAPTEVLARQHFISLSEQLMPLGINVVLLVGAIDPESKKEIYRLVLDGTIDIVVGTHAVIQESLEFKNLALSVIDEQHKFGVTQRSALKKKGYNPHVLIMTATPIPRTLAMTVYGDLDISIIKELPKGRKPISTYWVEEEKRARVYDFIKEELSKGRQAYVVCPLVEGKAAASRLGTGAVDMFEKLKNKTFKDFKVGLLHGRMSSAEKESVMKGFKKNKIQILVSTIVIEVGIDVPNASVMLIENAHRFGLAQLHQLRGRVGRGSHESYCILLADPGTEEAVKRLKAIEDTLDGFEIAEADLGLRGPGEFLGAKQHGLPEIRFGNILKDLDIMKLARHEAFGLVANDPELREEHHQALKEAIRSRFKGKLDLIGVG